MLHTEKSIIDWAFKNKIFAISSWYNQVDADQPVYYVELTSKDDSIRIKPGEFTKLFDVGLDKDFVICRLRNEQHMKAEQTQKNAEVERVERKELARLNKKYA